MVWSGSNPIITNWWRGIWVWDRENLQRGEELVQMKNWRWDLRFLLKTPYRDRPFTSVNWYRFWPDSCCVSLSSKSFNSMWIWSRGLLYRSLTVCSPSELQTNCGIRAIYNLLAIDLFSCFQKSLYCPSFPASHSPPPVAEHGLGRNGSMVVATLQKPSDCGHPRLWECWGGRTPFWSLTSLKTLWL